MKGSFKARLVLGWCSHWSLLGPLNDAISCEIGFLEFQIFNQSAHFKYSIESILFFSLKKKRNSLRDQFQYNFKGCVNLTIKIPWDEANLHSHKWWKDLTAMLLNEDYFNGDYFKSVKIIKFFFSFIFGASKNFIFFK